VGRFGEAAHSFDKLRRSVSVSAGCELVRAPNISAPTRLPHFQGLRYHSPPYGKRALTDREKEIVKLVVRGCRPEVALQIMVGFRGRLPLSPRETEIVQLVAQGCNNSDIAQKLSISVCTVKIHLGHIFRKLGVCDRQALTAFRILA
jgi:DNA-binding NarL/FixJ family response regulator